jgi:hypothetical protein
VGVQDECDTLEKSYVKMFNTNNWTGIPYMLDFEERDDRSINFDTAYSYSNVISSVQWCLPGTRANDGSRRYRYKFFVNEDGSGDAFYLNGTGVMHQHSFFHTRWENTFESGYFCEWIPERNVCERL